MVEPLTKTRNAKKIKCNTFEGHRVASAEGIEYAIRNEQMELEVGLNLIWDHSQRGDS